MAFANVLDRLHTVTMAYFGETVSIDYWDVQADFAEPYDTAYLGGVEAATTQPQITLRTADVPENPVGKTVQARSRTFTVVESRADGYGFTTLLLGAT